MAKQKRRKLTDAEKAEAVRLVQATGRSVYRVAQDLDLTETALRRCVKQAQVDSFEGSADALTTPEREELRRLRREARRLRMERDFSKEAAAFFARDSSSFSK